MIPIILFSSKVIKEWKRVNLGRGRIKHTIIHCTSKVVTAITASDSAITDMTPHFMLVARGVAARVDGWDFEGHDAQIEEMVDVELGWEAEDIRFGEVHPPKLDSFYRSPTGPLTPSASIEL